VVDSLYRLIADLERPDLELLRAYDVIEAMEWLQGTRVDIVLSDIRMPGMSGIQLQKEIRRLWPRCRIIFLTGFSEFDYAQEAIRGGGIVDYLVKTDGDQTIVRAVEKAIGEIESSLLDEHFLLKSKANMRQALPMLQKEYLLDMLQGERQTAKARADKFAELDIRLEPEAPLLLLIGRVDGWDGHYTSSDRTLFVFAIQNIVEEYMQIESNVAAISYDSQTMIWLIQPAETADEPERFAMARWDKLKHYAYQTLEPIQETCRKLLKVSLSFVMANSETEWDMLEPRFNKLKFLLGNRYGLEEEVIVLEHETENDGDAQYQTVRTQRGRLLGQLEGWLEKGQKDKFLLVLDDYMRLELPAKEFHLFEAFYPLALFFMSYINRNGQFRQL
ncbi:MAG: response regulator, partial [Cohnella sp.]|nr:response regulator [Cohnella sp.]